MRNWRDIAACAEHCIGNAVVKNTAAQAHINLTYSTWLSYPSSSAAQLSGDEPALASIMTHDHAEDLCASELDTLRI